MKRSIGILIGLGLLTVGSWNNVSGQTQGLSKMLANKHNLSASGLGSIRAANERQLCVFCHTPHVPGDRGSMQLWNHQYSEAEYTLYSSDYLANLGYENPGQPNARSKLCLSCHDGTVAIGAVYNNAGARNIPMQGDLTLLPAHSPSYIGISLANDHPVGFVYDNTKDPELVARSWPWGTSVRLDPDAHGGTIECVTCHDPHDDTNGHFLRMDNTNAALCSFCHAKDGWSDAIHKISNQSYTTRTGTQTTIGEWACRSCHQSHGGEGIPYLLTSAEENTCFGSGCHGKTSTGPFTKSIQRELEKLYGHPTMSVSGRHQNPDNASSLGITNRHAECQDCHNSHRLRKGLHTLRSNEVSNVLLGVRGVLPAPTEIWLQPTTYTEMNPATEENQICLKCHSSYAFGQVPNGVTSIIGPSGGRMTDQAMEFNPANKSAHPVRVSLNAQVGSQAPRMLTSAQLSPQWNDVGAQTMYCSDCHGNDDPTSATSPQGPHGSNVRFMLTGQGKFWPTNAFGELWSLDDIRRDRYNWRNDLFCGNCHPMYDGSEFLNNVHEEREHRRSEVKCITCHVTVPHGAKRSRLIGYESDVQPYNYMGTGIYDKLVITGFEKPIGPFFYEKRNCSMNGVCHGAQVGIYEP